MAQLTPTQRHSALTSHHLPSCKPWRSMPLCENSYRLSPPLLLKASWLKVSFSFADQELSAFWSAQVALLVSLAYRILPVHTADCVHSSCARLGVHGWKQPCGCQFLIAFVYGSSWQWGSEGVCYCVNNCVPYSGKIRRCAPSSTASLSITAETMWLLGLTPMTLAESLVPPVSLGLLNP